MPLRGASAMNRVWSQDERDDTTSPATPRATRLGRGPTADDRPDRDAGAGDPADHRVGGLAGGPLEVSRDQCRHGRQHQRGPDSFEERPSEREVPPTVGASAAIADPTRIDDQADHERTPVTNDVADLPPVSMNIAMTKQYNVITP